MKIEIKFTEDGSHTLFVPSLSEHYHSVHGAVQESVHVFIHAGFNAVVRKEINILEVGFGTGLNALLTWIKAQERKSTVSYFTCEPNPLKPSVWQQLNYPALMNQPDISAVYARIHQAAWGKEEKISDGFTLCKMPAKIENMSLFENHFHLVYFDAFAPAVQPELWTEDIFRKIFASMTGGGNLVTYSARGEVRRNLIRAGFSVERLHGPPGKREMLRARKETQD